MTTATDTQAFEHVMKTLLSRGGEPKEHSVTLLLMDNVEEDYDKLRVQDILDLNQEDLDDYEYVASDDREPRCRRS